MIVLQTRCRSPASLFLEGPLHPGLDRHAAILGVLHDVREHVHRGLVRTPWRLPLRRRLRRRWPSGDAVGQAIVRHVKVDVEVKARVEDQRDVHRAGGDVAGLLTVMQLEEVGRMTQGRIGADRAACPQGPAGGSRCRPGSGGRIDLRSSASGRCPRTRNPDD